MERVLVFITQLRNLTPNRIGFRVPCGLHPVRDMRAGKTRIVKQYRILRYCRENGRNWSVGVLIDGNYTGVEIESSHLLKYACIVFRKVENGRGGNVLVVDGIKENSHSDYLLRLRYFGWMRNIFWDKRPSVEINRSDSGVATKLRGIEAPFTARRPSPKRQAALAPPREAEKPKRKSYVYPTVPGNESNARKPVPSRLSSDSDKAKGEKLEKKNVGDPDVKDKSEKNTNTDGKLNHVMYNAGSPPPPQPPRRPNNIRGLMDNDPDDNYMDAFVNGFLFVTALGCVVAASAWIG